MNDSLTTTRPERLAAMRRYGFNHHPDNRLGACTITGWQFEYYRRPGYENRILWQRPRAGIEFWILIDSQDLVLDSGTSIDQIVPRQFWKDVAQSTIKEISGLLQELREIPKRKEWKPKIVK